MNSIRKNLGLQTVYQVLSVCLPLIDALICGPYQQDLPPAYERFCSSANQELILLSDRYRKEDFGNLPLGEYIFDGEGNAVLSGICLHYCETV